VRLVNMRGVNLNVFDFDYDLTWAAFLMNADEKIYGRFGGRDANSPDHYLTLAGLKYALRAALAAHRREPKTNAADEQKARTVEQYSAAKGLKPKACIHCHQVYDFRREERKAARTWRLEDVWVYPLPGNVGLIMDEGQGHRVRSVAPDSAAGRAGLRSGDIVQRLNGQPVASFADVQYALHRAPAKGTIPVSWQREDKTLTGSLNLAEGWRQTDISWRTSMWGLEPVPGVYGHDLTAEEKKVLGLTAQRLAFRQGQFVPPPARAAGVQAQDIILGIDQKPLEMTMLQFNAYVRLNYQVGDRITLNVLRNGNRLDLPMTLSGRGH
jgi:predicted metalloprotease with PDZ domain